MSRQLFLTTLLVVVKTEVLFEEGVLCFDNVKVNPIVFLNNDIVFNLY